MRLKFIPLFFAAIGACALVSCTTNNRASKEVANCPTAFNKEPIDILTAIANQGKIDENKDLLISARNQVDTIINCLENTKKNEYRNYAYFVRGKIYLNISELSKPHSKKIFLRRANDDFKTVIEETKKIDGLGLRELAFASRSYAKIEQMEMDDEGRAKNNYGSALIDINASIDLLYKAKLLKHEKLTEILTNKAIGARRASARITGSQSAKWAKDAIVYATVAMNHARENGLSLAYAIAQQVRAESRRQLFDARGFDSEIEPLREAITDHQHALETLSPEIGKNWVISVKSFAYTLLKLAAFGPPSERLGLIKQAEDVLDTLIEKVGYDRIEKVRATAPLLKANFEALKGLHICTKEGIQHSFEIMDRALNDFEKYLVKSINKKLSSNFSAIRYGIVAHGYRDFPPRIVNFFDNYKEYMTKLRLLKLEVSTESCHNVMFELPELKIKDSQSFQQIQ